MFIIVSCTSTGVHRCHVYIRWAFTIVTFTSGRCSSLSRLHPVGVHHCHVYIQWVFIVVRYTSGWCSLFSGAHAVGVHRCQTLVQWEFIVAGRSSSGCSSLSDAHPVGVHRCQTLIRWVFIVVRRSSSGCSSLPNLHPVGVHRCQAHVLRTAIGCRHTTDCKTYDMGELSLSFRRIKDKEGWTLPLMYRRILHNTQAGAVNSRLIDTCMSGVQPNTGVVILKLRSTA